MAMSGPEIVVSQLWFFWVMPIVGALIGAIIYKALLSNGKDDRPTRPARGTLCGAAEQS